MFFDKIIREDDSIMMLNNGDGETQDNAIVTLGALDDADGVNYEYRVLEALFGEYTFLSQSLVFVEDKVFDLIGIITSDKKVHRIWFDITDFYGKGESSDEKNSI